MATTGISALGNDQIIAIAALSSKNAATAEFTTGGNGLQGLYNTVHDNSGSWTGGGGGADYTAGAGIDITNDVISVTGKEDTITYGYSGDAISSLNGHAILSNPIPYEVYGISASANISAYESDSALWISGRDWTPELNNKLDSTAQVVTSTAGDGTYVTAINGMGISGQGGGGGSTYTGDAQGALDEVYTNSANWNSTYNTVYNNSASWTGSDFTGLFQAQYGTTTYNDIKNAVDNHKIVYCQSGGRMAFLAYSGSNNYEFQYYRSLTGHTTAAQGDQVFVYTINNANTWSVTTRNTYTEIKPSAGLASAFTNGTAAKLAFSVSNDILNATATVAANSANWQSAYDQLGNVTALLDSL